MQYLRQPIHLLLFTIIIFWGSTTTFSQYEIKNLDGNPALYKNGKLQKKAAVTKHQGIDNNDPEKPYFHIKTKKSEGFAIEVSPPNAWKVLWFDEVYILEGISKEMAVNQFGFNEFGRRT